VFSPKMSSLLLPSFRILAIAASIILVPRSDAGYAASFTTQSPVAPLRIRREALLSSSAHVSKQRALIRSCLKELRGGAGDGVDASSTRSEESDYGDHIVSPVAAIAASSTESEDSIENSANPGLARAKRKRGDAISASLSRKDALKRAAAEQGYAALSSSERDSSLDEIGPGSPEARSTPVEGTLGALAAEEQVSKRARVDLIRQDGTRGSIAASKHSSGKRIESDNEYRDVRSNRCKDYAETGICPCVNLVPFQRAPGSPRPSRIAHLTMLD
jgi:hypothetical protein